MGVTVSSPFRLRPNLTSELLQFLRGVAGFGNQYVEAHWSCVVELVLSASMAMELESRAIIETLGATEHGDTIPGADSDPPGCPPTSQ